MEKPLGGMIDLVKLHIQKGESDRSKALAEEIIREYPEDFHGYVLMLYHYYLLDQKKEVHFWMEETLSKFPEDEGILEMVIYLYERYPDDDKVRRELIKTGLRLYPNNHFFHAQYAAINDKADNTDQALASYEEAIRLDPHNATYLGKYAVLLYQMNQPAKGEKYERLSLQEDPYSTYMLVNFAWIAYQLRRYKKAQFLIDEAMRIEPNEEYVREYYKIIYPTRNIFVRTKAQLNSFLSDIFKYPSLFFFKLFRERVPKYIIAWVVILIEIVGLYIISGKKLFSIIVGTYFLILFISSKISKSMLKNIGFTSTEELKIDNRSKTLQQTALEEMKEVAKTSEQHREGKNNLSADELSQQLTEVWGSTNTSNIQSNLEKSISREEFSKESTLQTEDEKQASKVFTHEQTEGYSKWPILLMIASIILSIGFRHSSFIANQLNQPKPIPDEIQATIHESQQNFLDGQAEDFLEENMQVLERFIQYIGEDDLENALSPLISEESLSLILEHSDDVVIDQLANSKIEKVMQPTKSMPTFYFLLGIEAEDFKAVVHMSFGHISALYIDSWVQFEEEEKYRELMEQIELHGETIH